MSLKSNILNTFFTRVAVQIFGVISVIIYARILGPTNYGAGIMLTIIPPVLIKFLNLGIIDSTTYFVNQNPDEKKEYIGTALSFSLIVAVFATGLLYLLIPAISKHIYKATIPDDVALLVLIYVPVTVMSYYFKYTLLAIQSIKAYNYITVVMASLLNFSLTISLIAVMKLGVKGFILVAVITSSIEAIVMGFLLLKNGLITFQFHKTKFKQMLQFGLKGMFANFSGDIGEKIDRLLIGLFLTLDQVGIYQVALNISNKLKIFHQSISLPLYPTIASMQKPEAILLTNKLLNMILWPVTAIVIGAAVVSPYFITLLFGEKYHIAIIPFILLAIGVIFDSLNKVIGYFFLGTGRPGIWSIQKFIDLCINAVLLYLLIPVYGIAGGGFAGMLAAFATYLVMYASYRRGEKISERIYSPKIQIFTELAKSFRNKKNLGVNT